MYMNPDSCRTLIVIGDRMAKNKKEYIGLYRKVREMINIFLYIGITTFVISEYNEVGKMIVEVLRRHKRKDINIEFFDNHPALNDLNPMPLGEPENMYIGIKGFQYDPQYMMSQACFFFFITEEVKPNSLTYIINRKAQQEGKRVYTI